METTHAAYDEVYCYAMQRPGFLLQHVVDATVVQTASLDTKPIAIWFGLVGLYLHVEMRFSGRRVQQAHMALARTKREWPILHLPDHRGNRTAADVLSATPGPARDHAIEEWCKAVWGACGAVRETIIALSREHRLIESP